MADDQRLRELGEKYEGYKVYDNAGERIGKVDDLFVDEADREEYIGVKMGLFGLGGTTLIPMDIVRVNERERIMEVADSKDHVKDAPNFDDDDDFTPEFEDRIRRHFGLESLAPSAERGTYGRSVGREEYRNREDMGSGSAMGSAGAGDAAPSGGLRDLETGDRGRMEEDERFRERFREGFREGLRVGSGRGEPSGREGPGSSGTATSSGPPEEEMTRRGAGEGDAEQEEGGVARVWRRVRR